MIRSAVTKLLNAQGISLVAPLSLAHCRIQKPYLLSREHITQGTAFLIAVPYYTTKCDDCARNISAYAVSRDYHLFFETLFAQILPTLREKFPEHRFVGFTDHSPIAEAHAAVCAGLGFWGCNHLFMTEAHSSFVFLGEIITDAVLDAPPHPERHCSNCGACRNACPVSLDSTRCLSALTQKKGELTDEEKAALLLHGCAWGCDICQRACPVTARAKKSGTLYSDIPFFHQEAIPHLSPKTVQEMSDEEFAKRAYSWRGRPVILRNLEILKKGEQP